MGLSEALLNESKSWVAIEKKINTIRKSIDRVGNDIAQLRKDCNKAGSDPEDWSIAASYATDNLNDVLDKAQKLVDLFK